MRTLSWHDFLGWWRSSLLACLPASWRDLVRTSLPLYRLGQYEGEIRFWQQGTELDGLTLSEGTSVSPTSSRRHIEIALIIDASLVVHRHLVMPLVAEKNLRQVLAYEMVRRTPFRADEVCFHWSITERSREARSLSLELYAVPRQRCEAWCRQLGARGFTLARIDVADEQGLGLGVNLLDGEVARRSGDWRTGFVRLLAVLALGLLIAALFVPVWRLEQAALQLRQEVDEARTWSLQSDEQLDALEHQHGSLERVFSRHAGRPAAIALLAELAQVLPDGTWLQQLDMSQGRVSIIGESDRAAALIERLERSPLLTSVGFEAPVDTDPATGFERFRIVARLDAEEASDEAQR